MKTNEKFDVTIPFPAWDGISKVNEICSELRRNEIFAGIPIGTPRRITMRQTAKLQPGFDDIKIVKYWFGMGSYATATLGGVNTDYGMSWKLISLRLCWKWFTARWGGNFKLSLSGVQIEDIRLARYLRAHIQDYAGRPNHALAQNELARAERISDAEVASLANSIRQSGDRASTLDELIDLESVLGGGIRKN